MPRAFSHEDRESIRATLIAGARKRFIEKGLRAVTLREITAEAGISLGAFYRFWPTKEALFFDILEAEEADVLSFDGLVLDQNAAPFEQVKALIRHGLERALSNPFLSVMLRRGEYDHLMQNLPRERLTAHRLAEAEHIGTIAQHLVPELELDGDDRQLVDAMLELVFLAFLYRDEFPANVFDRLIDRQLDLVAQTLTGTRK